MFSTHLERLRTILRCPDCRGSLRESDWICATCGRSIRVTTDDPIDVRSEEQRRITSSEIEEDAENAFKNFFKRWPTVYRTLTLIVAPILFTGLTVKKFLARTNPDALVLNVGSGSTRALPSVINLDLTPFPNVDVVAFGSCLPFVDASFDVVCSEQVLEHVPRPVEVVREMVRVTKPGGQIFISIPFVYPYHPSPKDYTRWSIEGVTELLSGCEIERTGITNGPTSGMLVVLSMWLAIIFSFGVTPLRKILNFFWMFVLSPLKLLDLVYARLPGAGDVAACVYVVAKK